MSAIYCSLELNVCDVVETIFDWICQRKYGADHSCNARRMDSCLAVEREVDRVLSSFNSVKVHADHVLHDITKLVENLQQQYASCKFLIPFENYD